MTATYFYSGMRPPELQEGRFSLAREIAILAFSAALLVTLQVILAPLPNIELVSLLTVLYTLSFRKKALFSIYTFVFLEGLIYGFQFWWVMYLYLWLILWAIALRFGRHSHTSLQWALVTGIFGLLFGFLCAFVYIPVSGWKAAFAWWVAGIPLDIVHGISNFVLTFVLFRPLEKILARWTL